MRCFALILLPCLLYAADQRAPQPHQRDTPSKAAPRLTDPQLESAIRAKFAKSKINADKFTVRVQGGVATLEGRTDIIQHKGTATRLARTSGATAVNNRIQISDAARQRAVANLEKGRRRVQVLRGERGEPRSDASASRRR
jgi:hypothetical protein